jgi:hypothetical protein
MDELKAVTDALLKVGQSAPFAQQYGPYYFALALLVVGPFICRVVFWKSLQGGAANNPAYQDFRFYFRSTVIAGLMCVAGGVGWFFYDNYYRMSQTVALMAELRLKVTALEGDLKNRYNTVAGIISTGLAPTDELHVTMIDSQRCIVFARVHQSSNLWIFAVISEKELDAPVMVAWSSTAGGSPGAGGPQIHWVPMRIVAHKKFGLYKFSFAGAEAKLEPLGP